MADPLDDIEQFLDDAGLFQGIQISGNNSFTLQGHALEGSKSAFEGQRWDTDSLVRRSSLHIEGPIWQNLGIQADISSTGWGRSYNRFVLGWTTDETQIYYGDLNVRLSGNEFASFNKTLEGWQLDQALPNNGLLRAFYSREKGLTRRETINGNNTSGPFFLRYTPIIEGSEVVKVDEEVMRFGEDYRLDYETGQLRFEPVDGPPRIIPSTSVISVSYQSYGWQSTPGNLYGARAEMPLLGDKMLVGLTALVQDKRDPGSVGDTAGFQEDIFQGSGTTGPFDVNFRPILPNGATVVYEVERQTIDQTVVVLVDNVEQVQGVDYDVYHDIGRIIFRRAVPPTSLVVIRYYYDLGEPVVGGDSRVVGLDLGWRVAEGMTLRADWAQSDQDADGLSGQALRSSLSFSRPRLNATLEIRDVQPEFSYLDTVGFQRKEKGLNFAAQWQANDHISVYERFSNLKSDSGLLFGYSGYTGYSGGGISSFGVSPAQTRTTSLETNTQRNDFGVDVRYPGWPTLSFTRQDMENSGGSRGDSRNTTNSLRLTYSPREQPYSLNLALSDSSQRYLGTEGGSGLGQPRGSSTNQMQLSAQYSPFSTLNLGAHFATNSSTSLGATGSSSGVVTQLSASWTPSSRLSLNLDHTMSESDGAVTSGFYGGIGGFGTGTLTPYQIPDNPGGGGGELPGEDDEEQERSRYEDTDTRLNLSYRPTERINLSLSAGWRDYTSGGGVGYLADSEQTYYNASAAWRLAQGLSLTTTWGSDEMRFLEEDRGAVTNDMLSLGLNYRPEGQAWGMGLNLHRQSGSSPTSVGYGESQVTRVVPTDLFDISGELTYDLGPGMSLFGRLGRADYDSGYAVFTKDTGEVGLRYRMSDLADINFGYRYIRNISGEPDLPLPGAVGGARSGQNYIAHTVMLGLSSNFTSGLGSAGRAGSTGYSGYGGSLSSFGGYSAGGYGLGGYGYAGSGLGDFSGASTYRRTGLSRGYDRGAYGTTPFGGGGITGGTGWRSQDFSAGATLARGSSATYRPTVGRSEGFEVGEGEFRRESEEQRMQQPPAPFGSDGGMQRQPGEGPPPGERPTEGEPPGREGLRRWWQWYE
ncbi:MAG: hypothetical protein ACP5KN_11920 [Armatimonadota bacterium]